MNAFGIFSLLCIPGKSSYFTMSWRISVASDPGFSRALVCTSFFPLYIVMGMICRNTSDSLLEEVFPHMTWLDLGGGVEFVGMCSKVWCRLLHFGYQQLVLHGHLATEWFLDRQFQHSLLSL